MKSLVQDLIHSPAIILLVVSVFAIYSILVFQFLSKDKKFAEGLEKAIAVLFVFLLSGVAISPFTLINPAALTTHSSIRPTSSLILQLAIYAFTLLLLSIRFRYTLRDSLAVLVVIITRSPFFFLLLLIIGLSALWSDTPEVTLKASIAFLGTTAFGIYIAKQYNWQELTQILRWSNTAICIASFFYSVLKPSIGIGIKGWKGLLGHENQLGALMALTVILWFLHADGRRKNIWISAGFILLSLIVLQNSNTAGAKVILVGLVTLLIFLRFIKPLSFQWSFVAVVIFMVFLSCASLLILENLQGILGALGKDLTFTGRTDIWPDIIDAIKQRPLVGYGFYGFWQKWRGLDNPAYNVASASSWKPPHAHNGFLDIGLDLGLLGLVFFVLSLLHNVAKAVLYMSRSQRTESVLPLVLLVYTVLTNLSETGFLGFTNAWLYHVLCAVSLSLDYPEKRVIMSQENESLITHSGKSIY